MIDRPATNYTTNLHHWRRDMLHDRTAQTAPLTIGQQIVAKWVSIESPWVKPADLADAIDDAIQAEREACARLADEGMLVPPDGGSPTQDEIDVAKGIAAAIRNRT